MMKRTNFIGVLVIICLLLLPVSGSAAQLKGLLVYDSIYGSTIEVAYWIKAIVGIEHPLDVKRIDQVITVAPYDYVIIGSYSKNEKPSPRIYKFIEVFQNDLAQKKVCYWLTGGDWDETMVLKVPGGTPHLIAGRNYLFEIMEEKHPNIKPVVIGGFGGRQVAPALQGFDAFQIWLLEKLAKEGAAWKGLDIWESLQPERVEAFGNEVRVKVLGLQPLSPAEVKKFRGFWTSLQPASLSDPKKVKRTPKPYTERISTDRIFFSRSRIKSTLDSTTQMLQQWAKENNITLKEQRKTFFNVYYHAIKNYGGKELTIHVVPATFPDDPGNVHISFRSYDKPADRKGLEEDVAKAEALLWADGRKVEGGKESAQPQYE
jgi:menaquinone-dependent protoporphyrinogen IX oxidase